MLFIFKSLEEYTLSNKRKGSIHAGDQVQDFGTCILFMLLLVFSLPHFEATSFVSPLRHFICNPDCSCNGKCTLSGHKDKEQKEHERRCIGSKLFSLDFYHSSNCTTEKPLWVPKLNITARRCQVIHEPPQIAISNFPLIPKVEIHLNIRLHPTNI